MPISMNISSSRREKLVFRSKYAQWSEQMLRMIKISPMTRYYLFQPNVGPRLYDQSFWSYREKS